MRRALAVSAVLCLATVALVPAAQKPARPAADLAERLVGTWVAVGPPGEVGEPPAAGGELKHFTGRHWAVTSVEPGGTTVRSAHGGTYTLDGDAYAETVEYAAPEAAEGLGKTFRFRLALDGDTLTQTGVDNPFSQVLRRVK